MNIWKYIREEWGINSVVFLLDVIEATCTTLFGLASANILTEIVRPNLSAVFICVSVLGIVSILWATAIFVHEKCLTIAMQKNGY
ncbi:hypothetical protein [Liquorilactobacillus cacaonum]|uniref:hypothetical protein n=1 Tax=Liquorilactobacillus cacaonum TaxID=483012 RepID=UPI00070FC51D|nr:hypothetical protein [Liquorilactobacillus cacaonum]